MRLVLLASIWLFATVATTFIGWDAVHTVSAAPNEERFATVKKALPDESPESQTFTSDAGTLSVRCRGQIISLNYATPEVGATLTVEQADPLILRVSFRNAHQLASFTGRCHQGVPEGRYS